MLKPVLQGIAFSVLLLIFGTPSLWGQQSPPAKAGAPVELSGKEMFKAYCASCHGEDAKGNGPAAAALKVPPPDLTTLAKRNKGKFPSDYVNTMIVHGANTPAHGSAEMPVWGPVFMGINDQRMIVVHPTRIAEYLETLQTK